MMSMARAKTDMLAVLDHHVLQNVGHILAAIDGALEELVDLFELDQGDRVLLFIEQLHHTASADQVRLVFQAIDFDAVLHDGAVVLQSVEGLLQSFGATGHNLRKLHHGRGDRVDAVAILGAGFEGGMLGTILAYKGAKVVIIDAGTHPRFALGESTVRHTFRMIKIMAERFGVPEFKTEFNSGELLHKHVSNHFGVKKNFGFVYHRAGAHQRPEEATQLVIPPYREGYEAHLFRQDTDQYLTYTAIHHGATVKYNTRVKNVETDAQGVTLTTEKGETIRAKFVADASGGGHVLARMWNLSDKPPRVRLQTRCLFTHMIDVKPYDDLNLPNGVPKAPRRWYQGTCHHIFDGGWLWVIPFDNREGSANKCVSVGLSFDMRKFPKPTDITPDEEWRQFLDKFPSIKEQFKDAKLVRDWVSSDRLQGSCKQTDDT